MSYGVVFFAGRCCYAFASCTCGCARAPACPAVYSNWLMTSRHRSQWTYQRLCGLWQLRNDYVTQLFITNPPIYNERCRYCAQVMQISGSLSHAAFSHYHSLPSLHHPPPLATRLMSHQSLLLQKIRSSTSLTREKASMENNDSDCITFIAPNEQKLAKCATST